MINNRLKELRTRKGKTQLEMAEIMGISQQTWSSWEKGRTSPQAHQMQFLEEYFSERKEDIFFDKFNYKMKLKINGCGQSGGVPSETDKEKARI